MASLAAASPPRQLTVLVRPSSPSQGPTATHPAGATPTTVTFKNTAWASVGTPAVAGTSNRRTSPAVNAPAPRRVSSSRTGATIFTPLGRPTGSVTGPERSGPLVVNTFGAASAGGAAGAGLPGVIGTARHTWTFPFACDVCNTSSGIADRFQSITFPGEKRLTSRYSATL